MIRCMRKKWQCFNDHRKENKKMNKLKIHEAIKFAVLAHKNQVRKGTDIPYIVHPMEVMQILTENGCSENVIVAGILHDTLEDTATTPEQIVEIFDRDVLNLVQSQSEDKSKSWHDRKQHTIDTMKYEDAEVQLICCADKLSNLKSIYADKLSVGEAVFDRFNASKEETAWYYTKIVKSLTKINEYKMKKELEFFVNLVFGDE